jgi:hypothetical protein
MHYSLPQNLELKLVLSLDSLFVTSLHYIYLKGLHRL